MTPLPDLLRRLARRSPRLYALLRGVKAAARSLAAEGPLTADSYRARIEIEGALPAFSVGAADRVRARVTNTSSRPWPRSDRLFLSYHWHRVEGGVWAFDGGRVPLFTRLAPGEATAVELTVRPPNTPANYALELDLVEGQDGWFAQRGSPTLRQEVSVAGLQPDKLEEIDYEQVYAAADLKKDFWAVVGPATAEEFHQLGRSKLEMLKTLGLAPTSRILDVGCGTGSLAGPALEFLSDDGLFYGTDLSEKAVEFCREHYPRPNFRFAKNGMTTLPIDDLRFDFIVFFSVFTHTYPSETRDLLAEAARLLAPEGTIVADVFECDIDGDSLGTRAMIVLDRRRMLDLASELGLQASTISEFTWNETGTRRIDRVLRRFGKR